LGAGLKDVTVEAKRHRTEGGVGRILAAVVASVVLVACAGGTVSRPTGPSAGAPLRTTQRLSPAQTGQSTLAPHQQLIPRPGTPSAAPADAQMRAALLVPLTGPSAPLGQALVNAAQMALFDVADDRFVLQVYDTQSTPDQVGRMTAKAIAEGAQIILGPVFAADARVAGATAAASGVNVVTFSTDPSVAGKNVFVLGFLVQEQVRQIIAYARSQGRSHFAVLAPESAYGSAVVEAFKRYVPSNEISKIGIYSSQGKNQEDIIKQIASYDSRKRALNAHRAQLSAKTDEASQAELKRLKQDDTAGDVDFDAILLPDQGAELTRTAALLPFYDIDPARVQFLGTLLWNQPGLGREPALQGGVYPAPPPDSTRQFNARYRELYGAPPPTLASHAYDAVALAGALAHSGMSRPFSVEQLTSPSGFAGIDGVFRFLPNGLSERGFAIMQVTRGGTTVVQPAPTTFAGAQY
jgi:ABC-type branched-subunit amino acid transport system substrate-binding protein